VVVELKCAEKINHAHNKPLPTYLRFNGLHLGFLLHFSESPMKNGINRMVDHLVA
jgi:GxxExxY protein